MLQTLRLLQKFRYELDSDTNVAGNSVNSGVSNADAAAYTASVASHESYASVALGASGALG